MTSESEVQMGPCCFCGRPITETHVDPCRVTVETQAGKWQVWFCHAQCFRSQLASLPNGPDFFAPAHF